MIKIRVIWLIGLIGNPQCIDILSTMLIEDQDIDIKINAAKSLGKVNNSLAINALKNALRVNKNRDVIWAVRGALALLGDLESIEFLLNNSKNAEQQIVKESLQILGEIGDERAVEALLMALFDSNQEIQEKAVFLLGKIGSEEVLKSLLSIIDCELGKFRTPVIRALAKIDDERAVKCLLPYLRDSDKETRETVAFSLWESGNWRAIEALFELFHENDNNVMILLACALSKTDNVKSLVKNIEINHNLLTAIRFCWQYKLNDNREGMPVKEYRKWIHKLLKKLPQANDNVKGSIVQILLEIPHVEMLNSLLEFSTMKTIIKSEEMLELIYDLGKRYDKIETGATLIFCKHLAVIA